jgi:ATP-binding cassette subfamily F protein 3
MTDARCYRGNLSISNDDRIGLLGANGNGKSTFAKLVANRIDPMTGTIRRSSRLDVGFFAQHQIDELDSTGTACSHIADLMRGATQAQIRARCARIGFPGGKADTRVTELSGGEKARLLMGLATFGGPHLLIMDEPTNHLDIDSRAALIEAINEYEGAIILVSHDRYLLEACADRLWLVDGGTVSNFDGDMDDYVRYVLSKARGEPAKMPDPDKREPAQEAKREAPRSRKEVQPLKKRIEAAEQKMRKFEDLMQRIDTLLAAPDAFARDRNKAAELARQRAELKAALAATEEEWLALSAEFETAQA